MRHFASETGASSRFTKLSQNSRIQSPARMHWSRSRSLALRPNKVGIPEKSGERLDSETHSCMQARIRDEFRFGQKHRQAMPWMNIDMTAHKSCYLHYCLRQNGLLLFSASASVNPMMPELTPILILPLTCPPAVLHFTENLIIRHPFCFGTSPKRTGRGRTGRRLCQISLAPESKSSSLSGASCREGRGGEGADPSCKYS